MKFRALAPLLAIALFVAGCTSNAQQPDAQLIVAKDAYTFVVNEIDAALVAHLVTASELKPYLPARDAARAALARSEAARNAGNESAALTAIAEAQAALVQLQPLIDTIGKRKAGH